MLHLTYVVSWACAWEACADAVGCHAHGIPAPDSYLGMYGVRMAVLRLTPSLACMARAGEAEVPLGNRDRARHPHAARRARRCARARA